MKWSTLFFLTSSAFAAPLDSQYFPSISQTCSSYATSFGTITLTNDLYKVWQSSVAPGNVCWYIDYMMPNEIRSLQVHVSPSVNVTSLTVTMSNLTNAQNGAVISSATTNIVVNREVYMNVSTPTALSTVSYQGGARALMPDPLIPAKDPYWGQTTNAWPWAMTSTMTQSAWIDIHIPSATASGYFLGYVYTSSGSVVVSTNPVVIGVGTWVMPSTAALATVGAGFQYNGMCDISYSGNTGACNTYPGSPVGDTYNLYMWLDGGIQLLDNRYSIDGIAYMYPGSGSFTNYNTIFGPVLNGTASHVPSILAGEQLTTILINETLGGATFQNYATNFNNNGWMSKLFYYLCDEPPNGCSWATLLSNGTAEHGDSTPIIPNLVTTDIADATTNGVTGVIDWMTPIIENLDTTGSGNLRSTYNSWLAGSSGTTRKIGSYNDCESAGTCTNGSIGPSNTPPYPNRHVDGTAAANRAMETWEFLNNLSYELYFSIDAVDTSGNPWKSVYDFGCNGDGTIIYPSTAPFVTFPGISQSTPIWCPSMRLKYFRDGEQDYEYENKLTHDGYGTFVQAQIATWMVNGYTFNNSTGPVTNAWTGSVETARTNMFWEIYDETYPPSSNAPVINLNGGTLQMNGGTISP